MKKRKMTKTERKKAIQIWLKRIVVIILLIATIITMVLPSLFK